MSDPLPQPYIALATPETAAALTAAGIPWGEQKAQAEEAKQQATTRLKQLLQKIRIWEAANGRRAVHFNAAFDAGQPLQAAFQRDVNWMVAFHSELTRQSLDILTELEFAEHPPLEPGN